MCSVPWYCWGGNVSEMNQGLCAFPSQLLSYRIWSLCRWLLRVLCSLAFGKTPSVGASKQNWTQLARVSALASGLFAKSYKASSSLALILSWMPFSPVSLPQVLRAVICCCLSLSIKLFCLQWWDPYIHSPSCFHPLSPLQVAGTLPSRDKGRKYSSTFLLCTEWCVRAAWCPRKGWGWRKYGALMAAVSQLFWGSPGHVTSLSPLFLPAETEDKPSLK